MITKIKHRETALIICTKGKIDKIRRKCVRVRGGYIILGVRMQSVKSNLALREGRKDISDILWHFFSRKHKPILISELTFIKKKWEIIKNCIFCML